MRVKNWERWQSYRKDRGQPPWIKLHREVMRNPEWVQLSDAQRGQLVSIWILAADRNGELPNSPALIAKLCFMDTEPDLNLYVQLGFLEHDDTTTTTRRQDDAPKENRIEEKRIEEKTNTAEPVVDEHIAYTKNELLEMADTVLGLNRLDKRDKIANAQIINQWLYSSESRTPEDIYAAIHGAAMMREKDLIGWDSAKPGTPMGLRALNGPMTLAQQVDGKVKQTLWYAAVDYFRRNDPLDRQPKNQNGGMVTVADILWGTA